MKQGSVYSTIIFDKVAASQKTRGSCATENKYEIHNIIYRYLDLLINAKVFRIGCL